MSPFICVVCGEGFSLGEGELQPTGPMCHVCIGKRPAPEPQAPQDSQGPGQAPNPPVVDAPRAAEEQSESKGETTPLAGDRAACGVPGCVRAPGHWSFHTTVEAIAKREDAGSTKLQNPPTDVVPPRATEILEPLPMAEHSAAGGTTETKVTVATGTGDRAATLVELLASSGEVDIQFLHDFVKPKTRQPMGVEVEQWAFLGESVSRTPREVFPGLSNLSPWVERCRFVVVLEWRSDELTEVWLRDIGPWFTPRSLSKEDVAAALNTAIFWARGQAKRLSATHGTSYRPARKIS